MEEPIKRYMICTLDAAPFDDQGDKLEDKSKKNTFGESDGCSDEEVKVVSIYNL